jgi:hypothetical protein
MARARSAGRGVPLALLVATMMALFLSVKDIGAPADPNADDDSSTLASGLSPENVSAIEHALRR